MTITLTIDENGTVMLPASFRQRWGMIPASQVIAEDTEDGVLLKPTAPDSKRRMPSLEEKRALLKQVQGIWKDRDDLPDFAALRAAADRY
jgi:bifunctional DNA-binding transcriptional regulator/antitoxin component of YhaV-PrlF toxin-antitoxin module